jgi:hypothetical protein
MITISFFLTLAALLVGHFLADGPLQPGELSRGKRGPAALQMLIVHGAVHGLAVAVVTGSPLLGVLELITHAAIDGAKCRGWFGLKTDQALHFACKACWALAAPYCLAV